MVAGITPLPIGDAGTYLRALDKERPRPRRATAIPLPTQDERRAAVYEQVSSSSNVFRGATGAADRDPAAWTTLSSSHLPVIELSGMSTIRVRVGHSRCSPLSPIWSQNRGGAPRYRRWHALICRNARRSHPGHFAESPRAPDRSSAARPPIRSSATILLGLDKPVEAVHDPRAGHDMRRRAALPIP